MASPLHLFRKHQKAFLVGFGIVLMFAFVVAPPLIDFFQSEPSATGGGNEVAVTWKSGELRELDLERLRVHHLLTVRFLGSLVRRVEVVEEATVDLKGEPITLIKGRSFQFTDRTPTGYQIVIDGAPVQVPDSAVQQVRPKVAQITAVNNEEDLVHRMILAQNAKDIGVVIGEDTVLTYLDNLVDASSTNRPNYASLLRAVTDGRLDFNQFIQQMSLELAAQRMTIMAQAGLYTVSPAKLYECYNRLHRRVTADLLAVDVAEFVKDVSDPAADAVSALYEEGKNRYPDPFVAEPGFKSREQIAFGYFKGDFEQFVAREMETILPTITNEQIEKYYEDNKATQFTVTELPPDAAATPPAADGATPPAAPVVPAADAPATETPAPATEPTPTTDPATPAPPTPEPASPDPAAPASPGNPEPVAPPTEEGKQLPSGGSQSSMTAHPANLAFVSFETQEPAPTPPTDPAAPPAETAPAETAPAETAPVPPTEPAPVPQEMPATSETPAPQEPPAAPDASAPAQTPAPTDAPTTPALPTPPPADPAAAGQVTAEAAAGDQPAPKPVQYKPLDDALRATIRETLARNAARIPAQEKLDKAGNAVRQAVEEYGKQLSRIRGVEGAAKPTPPDFAALAKENYLTYERTPLWDILDVFQIQQAAPADTDPACYDIVRANETLFSQEAGMMRRSLINVGFASGATPFMPRRLIDGFLAGDQFEIPPEKLFIYWREEVIPETVPPLEKIREEVVRVWKMKQALPLARAKAEQLAKQAGEAGKPLSEVFTDNAAKVIKSNPFTWMTRGAVPAGNSNGATISSVSGRAGEESVTISGVGSDFMRAVFDLEPGRVGVAVNQPETFVYVVRAETEEPSEEVRRDEFFKAGMTEDVVELVREDQGSIYYDWIRTLIKDKQISWKRDIGRNWSAE